MTTHNSRLQGEAAGAELDLDTPSMAGPSDNLHQDRNPVRADLHPQHRQELYHSCISDKVIDGRGYRSVMRTRTDLRHESLLQRNGLAKTVWANPQRYPGLFMPQYSATGELRAGLYKPDKPRTNDEGKPRKYEAPQGRVRELWWAGSVPSLMHAKFIVADAVTGYFGSANLTSLGLRLHLEMGVALAQPQAESLLALLTALEAAGMFTETPGRG